VDERADIAKGSRKTHKFIYSSSDLYDINTLAKFWVEGLKSLFTYEGKFHDQNLSLDSGIAPKEGMFFLLVKVDLTRRQFDIITET
tara:strand:- start:289 stop:546 length:258 start_codon:yes stop_codon:yes gene_type:complete